MGEAKNPTLQYCVFCAHADKGATEWPCRCCTHINTLEDYFSPVSDDEEIPSHGDEIRALGNIGLAKFIIDRLHITCGNCPAEAVCMLKSGQETILPSSEACKHLFVFWLAQNGSGNGGGTA